MINTLPIIGGYGLEKDPKIDCQRTINMYVVNSPDGKNPNALVPMPGLKKLANFPHGSNVRACYTYKDTMYFVVENIIYTVNSSLVISQLGTINTASGYVDIDANESQVMFVDGTEGWIWDGANFLKITSAGFPAFPSSVAFLDGYFVVNHGGTNEFNLSALNDGTTWNALQFAKMVSYPDTIIGLAVFHRRLFLFGKHTTEVWYDAGASDFPFRRDDNLLLQYGCAAVGSIAVGGTDEDKRMFWLAGDDNGVGSIMMTSGTTPTRVSTVAVENAIKQYTNISDARGMVYKEDGHSFYELSFTADNHTWVYDVTTNLWFEREYQGGGRYITSCHTFFQGKHYVGHYNAGILYEMSSNYLDDDGMASPRIRITRHFADPSYKKLRISRLTADLTQGFGTSTGLDYDPQIFLSFSKDGGKVFGSKIRASTGLIGNREHRTFWKRLGSARDWVFKFEFYNKTKFFLLGASIDYEISGDN